MSQKALGGMLTEDAVDHDRLFSVCETLRGDFLMTYDNAEEVRVLAERHGFQTKPVAMKNTHHAEMNELLIGRNLDWVEEGGILREQPVPYRTATDAPTRAPRSPKRPPASRLKVAKKT